MSEPNNISSTSAIEEGSIQNQTVEELPQLPLLDKPRAIQNPVIKSESEFENAIAQILQGSGAIAVDTERASGFTYSQRAYLVQIFRRDGGLHLIDPVAFSNPGLWQKLAVETKNVEWIIHAATQDLPSLRELGLEVRHLFDTELGARIAGFPRVSLGTLCENLLEFRLAKEHSAVNWATRPLPADWLNYAALDVDVLVDLRDEVENSLRSQGKLDWAKEEFDYILKMDLKPIKVDPWRKVSGIHKIRNTRALATLRALWSFRDEVAKSYDISPGRFIPDDLLIEFSVKNDFTLEKFSTIVGKRTRFASSTNRKMPIELMQKLFEIYKDQDGARAAMTDTELPPMRLASTELPPPKVWKERNPLAYARYTHAKAEMEQLSQEFNIPVENALSPKILRDFLWGNPPSEISLYENYLTTTLEKMGARNWQISLTKAKLIGVLNKTEPLIIEDSDPQDDPVE